MARRIAAFIAVGVWCQTLVAASWDRAKAFEYLDDRQQQWAEWAPAKKAGGPCISCHTGIPYLVANRAAKTVRPHAQRLVEAVRARVAMDPLPVTLPDPGAEVVTNLFALSVLRPSATNAPDAVEQKALAQLWERQLATGASRGGWSWVNAGLDPMDEPHSAFVGSALAMWALSSYPDQSSPDHQGKAASLQRYFARLAPTHPLHDRLAWTAFSPTRDAKRDTLVLNQLWRGQAADGGWPISRLGPWPAHKDAPVSRGSNAYATAWAAFAAHQSGVPCDDPKLARALDWLEQQQDRATGSWPTVSMNKVYAPGSMPEKFLTDAATGFAVAALIGCGR